MNNEKVFCAAGVVRFIREKGSATVQELDGIWSPKGSAAIGQVCDSKLRDLLESLYDASLISWRDDFRRDAIVEVTPLLDKLRAALDFHLNDIERLHDKKAMIVFPEHGLPDKTQPLDVFVAMPFHAKFTAVWNTIKRCIRKKHLTVARADLFSKPRPIREDIWNRVNAAKTIVADCTGRNANVFYEIGLAHAIGREVILLMQNTSDMPFDLRDFRTIKYDSTPGGLKELAGELKNSLEATLQPQELMGELRD